jgi:DNA repair protein RadD
MNAKDFRTFAGLGPGLLQDELRPYQTNAVADYNAALAAGFRRILIVAPTGSGKSVIAANILDAAIQKGQHGLFLAHRRELIALASRKLDGCDHGILLPGYQPDPHNSLQVASIATIHRRAIRGKSIRLPDADIVVVDEAHRSLSKTYRSIIAKYPDAVILGLTATPIRGDGRGLGDVFETMIECPDVAKLTEAGYLVPARVWAPSSPDLTGVLVKHGDYSAPQLAERMNTKVLVGDIVEHWLRLAERRPTVVFATNIAHSLSIRDKFLAAGIRAEHIDSNTPEAQRDAVAAKLESGQIEVVCNAMVFVEGWDQPNLARHSVLACSDKWPAASCAPILARQTR